MEFTNGIKALVVIGRKKKLCDDSMQVYDFLYNNRIEWRQNEIYRARIR